MPDITIPDAAVEAAARAIAYADQSPYLNADQAEERVMRTLGGYRMLARKGLIAAAPYIAAQALRDAAEAFYGPDGPRGEVGPAVWLNRQADRIEADHG